jgi:hypothetical protein
MVRTQVQLLILSLLFASPAIAQSSWLHPSDREYQYAIDSAFGRNAVARDNVEALEFIRRLPDGTNSYISVRPPLACANLHAQTQRQERGRAPTADEVKEVCDGQLLVAVRYFSAASDGDRPFAIEHGDQEIKPFRSSYDRAPSIITIIDVSAKSEQVGYAYLDLHFVVPDAAWDDDVRFVTADVNGEQSTLTFNFLSQVENEQKIDDASR